MNVDGLSRLGGEEVQKVVKRLASPDPDPSTAATAPNSDVPGTTAIESTTEELVKRALNKPEVELDVTQSPRPRQAVLRWDMKWTKADEVFFPARSIRIITVTEVGGKRERHEPIPLEYDETNYTYVHKEDSPLTITFTVEAYGDEEDITSSEAVTAKFPQVDPAAVKNLKGDYADGKLTLSWDITGLLDGEHPDYDITVYFQSEFGKSEPLQAITVKKEEAVLSLTLPRKYKVEVVPVIGTYFGHSSTIDVTITEARNAPKNVSVAFDSPESVTIFFVAPLQTNPDLKEEGCEVNVCAEQKLSKKCRKKKLEHGLTSASFNVKESMKYYTTVRCKSEEGDYPRSPWVMFISPTSSKRTVPAIVHYVETGIDIAFDVKDGLNLELFWKFSYTNGSQFAQSTLKWMEVLSYGKAKGGVYTSELLTRDVAATSVNLGLSPSLTFDTGCHFYSLNVTYKDGYTSFVSSEETCYGLTSAGFLILYLVAFILLLIALMAIYASAKSRTKFVPDQTRGASTSSSSTSIILRRAKHHSHRRSRWSRHRRRG